MKILPVLAVLLLAVGANAQNVTCQQAFLDTDGLVSLRTFQDAAVFADVNGDGRLDVIVNFDKADSFYSVLLNAGGGAYRDVPPRSRADTMISGGGYPVLVDVRDMNGDGWPDLLFTGPVVSLGRGDGTFQKPVGSSIGFTSAGGEYVAFADFDGDGILDAAYGDRDKLILLRGAADGSFTKADSTSGISGYGEVPILTGDFDGDGRVDLAMCDPNSGEVLFKFNDGGFRFSGTLAFGPGPSARSFVTADVDGIGRQQLVAGALGTVYVMTADARRNVAVDKVSVDWQQPIMLDAAADLDGDGLVDLVTHGTVQASLGILWARGRRDFAPPVHYSFPTAAKVQVVDVDGDGRPEIVGRKMIASPVPVAHIRPGTRDLDTPRAFAAATSTDDWRSGGIAGDLNGDGNVDVVISSHTKMKVLLGDGHGGFGPPVDLDSAGGAVAIADLDGDGFPDLVSDSILFGRGDGSFAASPLILPGFFVALIDGGHAFLVQTRDHALQEVRVNRERAVASAETIVTNVPLHITTAEANGQITVAVYGDDPRSMTFFTKSPGGAWQKSTPTYLSTPPGRTPVHLADFNGDGRIDFIAGESVYINGPSGFRLTSNNVNASSTPYGFSPAFAVADLDGDGAPEIFANDEVWHNDGAGNFTRSWVGTVNDGNVFINDVDHDGKPDLLVISGSVVVVPGACVQPRVRMAQLGPAYENAPVEVALTSIYSTGGSIFNMKLRENGALIQPQMTPGSNLTSVLTLYPSLGSHTYTMSFPDVNSESTFAIDVTRHPPRRRAAGK